MAGGFKPAIVAGPVRLLGPGRRGKQVARMAVPQCTVDSWTGRPVKVKHRRGITWPPANEPATEEVVAGLAREPGVLVEQWGQSDDPAGWRATITLEFAAQTREHQRVVALDNVRCERDDVVVRRGADIGLLLRLPGDANRTKVLYLLGSEV